MTAHVEGSTEFFTVPPRDRLPSRSAALQLRTCEGGHGQPAGWNAGGCQAGSGQTQAWTQSQPPLRRA